MWKNCVMYLPQLEDMWGYVCRNTLETFCIRGAQIDKYGNVNNSVIGDFKKPKVRLPGSAGMGDMATLDKKDLHLVDDAQFANLCRESGLSSPLPAISTAAMLARSSD